VRGTEKRTVRLQDSQDYKTFRIIMKQDTTERCF